MIKQRLVSLTKAAIEDGRDTTIPVRRPFVNELSDERQKPLVVTLHVRTTVVLLAVNAIDEVRA